MLTLCWLLRSLLNAWTGVYCIIPFKILLIQHWYGNPFHKLHFEWWQYLSSGKKSNTWLMLSYFFWLLFCVVKVMTQVYSEHQTTRTNKFKISCPQNDQKVTYLFIFINFFFKHSNIHSLIIYSFVNSLIQGTLETEEEFDARSKAVSDCIIVNLPILLKKMSSDAPVV